MSTISSRNCMYYDRLPAKIIFKFIRIFSLVVTNNSSDKKKKKKQLDVYQNSVSFESRIFTISKIYVSGNNQFTQ